MSSPPLSGSCGCGAIRFEISEPLSAARQFVAYAAEWEPIPDDGLPRFDEVLPWR
jgi:hypothetical protein